MAGMITGEQLVGDTFQSNQGSQGSVAANSDGSYTFTSNGSLSGLGNSITITSADPSPSENFTATIHGGLFDGTQIPATIIANDAGDVLAQATINGQTYYIYETNDPAAQPAQGASVHVAAIGPNNPYTYGTVCFASGTLIRTTRGDVAVEALRIGDLAVTAAGNQRPITWIGHRTIDCTAHPKSSEVRPVRIRAGAFGGDLPEHDLRLSPGHPVLVGAGDAGEGGYLIPVMCLINGTTIEQVAVDEVTYWHVELDAHDILLANGLPAESYLDWGDRAFFREGSDHALANPEFVVPGLAGRCRPVAIDGPVVEAERRRLDGIFAMRLDGAAAWPLADDVFLPASLG